MEKYCKGKFSIDIKYKKIFWYIRAPPEKNWNNSFFDKKRFLNQQNLYWAIILNYIGLRSIESHSNFFLFVQIFSQSPF